FLRELPIANCDIGLTQLALACMKIMKYMDPLIEQLQAGITVDLSQLPQPYEEVADELAEQSYQAA
ncbi:hypothetical protein SARC_17885, partial [Sphaeroforma arctica JP610]